MIEFHCDRYKKDGTPVVSDLEILDYAEAVLDDYKSKLLKEPGRLNATHFLESYLGATLDYQDIYYEENDNPIAGGTVFNDGYIMVFDRQNMCVRPIAVKAGTILIDNSTMEDGKEGFAKFTHLHEGGHFLIHPTVYRRVSNQLTLFDLGMENTRDSHIVTCKRSAICGQKERSELKTEEDFREHHANTFAGGIAMPRPTFIPCAKEMIRKAGFSGGVWIESEIIDWDYDFALSSMIEQLADIFGVSKSAAKVQLKRLHLLISEKEYRQQRCQLAVNF